ncbi:MAG: HAD family hydrolase [Armatimonadetes bacterium]|nr:HAD family hydrolase [Armatimonadota bacterium]
MKVKGVFFDLYGTLVTLADVRAAWWDWLTALHSTLVEHGLSLDRDEFAGRCDGFFSKPEPEQIDDGFTVYERRMSAHLAELGLVLEPQHMRRAAMAALNAWHAHARLDPEARDVLADLSKNRKLALISNFDQASHVHEFLANEGLTAFFDVVVVSDDVGLKKPDPRIFRHALDRVGLSPEEVIHIGDMKDDVLGALSAGITPILIRREWADPIIPDFHVQPKVSVYFGDEDSLDGVRVIPALSELKTILSAPTATPSALL